MTLEEIRELNRVTEAIVAAARKGGASLISEPVPYYGYLTVDQFDCPPFVMFTNNDSPTVEYILKTGTFEPCSVALWCALAREATGVLDIGANVGIYSLCAAKLRPDLKVHAFEPNPYAYARLRIHKFVNGLSNLVDHPVGLGGKSAIFKFNWAVKPGGNIASGAGIGTLSGVETEGTVVPIITLDSTGLAASLGARPLVKIDVEGAEAFVLSGAKDLLGLHPDIILETLDPQACDDLNKKLLPLGYMVYGISEGERTLQRRDRLQAAGFEGVSNFNHFLTRRAPDELARLRPSDVTIRSAA